MGTKEKKAVAIVDYGLGNLFSVRQACEKVGLAPFLASEKGPIAAADAIILPGVGAFAKAMEALQRLDLVAPLRDLALEGKPFFGICLGLQLLMTESHEFGLHRGFDLIKGAVVPFPNGSLVENRGRSDERRLKVPHIGWSPVSRGGKSPSTFFQGISENENFYFVHSYFAVPEDPSVTCASSTYGETIFCSSIQQENVFAAQFHPERSGHAGLRVFQNFAASFQHRV